ncbi:MAG: NADH-quinone oxidoreductase subunit K [Bacteroidota bacterium]
MEIVLSILTGILYTAGVYLLIRRSIVKLIIGIILLSNATNLLIFVSAGLVRSAPAFVDPAEGRPENIADPLPQALILTAIVIGFGIVAFTLALKFKLYEATGTDDLDELKETD